MAISDLKYYLTSAVAGIQQTIYSQSIGGYPAIDFSNFLNSIIYQEFNISNSIGIYDNNISISSGNLTNNSFLSIHSDLSQVTNSNGNGNYSINRSINQQIGCQNTNGIIRSLNNNLFNDSFDEKYSQYRCFAIRNNGNSTFSNVSFYLKNLTNNKYCNIAIALEVPLSDSLQSFITSSSGSQLVFIDSSLINKFPDNTFNGCIVRFTDGLNINQYRTITSFTSNTGYFTVDSFLPYISLADDEYIIESTPSQRTISGTVSPLSNNYITDFNSYDINNPININWNNLRQHGNSIMPNDTVYIWIKRRLINNLYNYNNDSFTISIKAIEI